MTNEAGFSFRFSKVIQPHCTTYFLVVKHFPTTHVIIKILYLYVVCNASFKKSYHILFQAPWKPFFFTLNTLKHEWSTNRNELEKGFHREKKFLRIVLSLFVLLLNRAKNYILGIDSGKKKLFDLGQLEKKKLELHAQGFLTQPH